MSTYETESYVNVRHKFASDSGLTDLRPPVQNHNNHVPGTLHIAITSDMTGSLATSPKADAKGGARSLRGTSSGQKAYQCRSIPETEDRLENHRLLSLSLAIRCRTLLSKYRRI